MTTEPANPEQEPRTRIEIRPYRGGWQCFETPGVAPFWTGNGAKEDAMSYAKGRARFAKAKQRFAKLELDT